MKTLLALVSAVLISSPSAMPNSADTVSEEASQRIRLEESRKAFSKLSGKDPTTPNLIQSLTQRDSQGKTAGTVTAALRVLAGSDVKSDEVVREILLCFIGNPRNWTIRTECVHALLQIRKESGIEVAQSVLGDPAATLEAQLLVALHLVKAGELHGYPMLAKGLKSEKPIERRLAQDLLRHFRKYDHATIPSTKEVIDIQRLLSEVGDVPIP